jgi:glycosyltransferase involved in cell wall biosynthesis
MNSRMSAARAICLNMIVRDEVHIVAEVLDAVAPYISSWVIVDTGSADGTQDLIREHMAGLGIPGDLHERPWQDFGHNRSEALTLAQGHGDYIWVIDADDMVSGTIDFSDLSADVYSLRYGTGFSYWRRQVFRDGMPWRYVGVVHEYPACDVPFVEQRLEGEYHLQSRRLGGRNLDPKKYERDRDLLLAEVGRDPDDVRSVFYLAQSYFDLGDYGSARYWYSRRAEMGDFPEEVYYSLYRVAESMSRLDEPWPQVQDAYLKAWEFRPTRAEPLYAIAFRYRNEKRYQLGYLFAERAAGIPLPESDVLFVNADIYQWRALDEQAVCASWIGRNGEAFALFQRILAGGDVAEEHRARVTGNRDFCAKRLVETHAAEQFHPR